MGTEAPGLIVAVGASAGGLGAFARLLAGLPPDSGMAFVLLQHQAADRESVLDQQLRHHATMPVMVATEGALVRADHIYIAPPGAVCTIAESCLHLSRFGACAEDNAGNMRLLDRFFASLAEDRGERAACIILSGTGDDGSLGLRAIKAHGGLAIAQADAGAGGFDALPHHARATGLLDAMIPVAEMPAFLLHYAAYMRGAPPGQANRPDAAPVLARFADMLRVVHRQTGHDFSGYTPGVPLRRIQRRMGILGLTQPDAYLMRLAEDPAEARALLRDFLIGVTRFFRDRRAFAAVRRRLPPLLAQCDTENPFRLWVPACATGEEAYSLAVVLREAMAAGHADVRVQIFGSDIDEAAIEVARAGRYPARAIADLPPQIRQRWFTERDGMVEPVRAVRDMCVFSLHNVIRDPPFSRLHMISCRNLMMYLEQEAQDTLLRIFHFALRPDGLLFLGSSEGPGTAQARFTTVDRRHRIFSQTGLAGPPVMPTMMKRPYLGGHQGGPARGGEGAMARAAPVHVVVDGANQAVRFSAGPIADGHVDQAPGQAGVDLFNLLRGSLQGPVRHAVQQAAQTGVIAVEQAMLLGAESEPRGLEVIVEPRFAPSEGHAQGEAAGAPFFVVAFHRKDHAPEGHAGAPALEPEVAHGRHESGLAQIEALNEALRLALDESQTMNEGLRAANEELRSANEELAASREEMQTVNVELQTENVELNAKNDTLHELNSDFRNLWNDSQIATLLLGRKMQVRNFTPSLAGLFAVRAPDIGRPISDLVTRLDYATLHADFDSVQRTGEVVERELKSLDDVKQVFLARMRPHRLIDGTVDGAVVTFVDVTGRERAEANARFLTEHDPLTGFANRAMFHDVLERAAATAREGDMPAGLICLDLDRFNSVNDWFGHRIGDGVLRMVAQRLRRCAGTGDLVYRLGGDEFAVLRRRVGHEDDLAAMADRILAQVGAAYDIEGRSVRVSVSVGVAAAASGETDPQALPRAAELALRDAKARGGGGKQVFRASMLHRLAERHRLEVDLREAVARDELMLVFQPLVRVQDRRIVGAEALVRWRHPQLGLLQPGRFIPIAEETGLIVPIGAWVLHQACLVAASWPDHVRLSVNLSPIQFASPGLLDMVAGALRAAGLPARRLALEVTETVLLRNSLQTQEILTALRDIGVAISIDDFGTGYSSLGYLRIFAIDEIKIDQAFVKTIDTQAESSVIVKAVVGIGEGLGISVCAEGVETEAQFLALQSLGVRQVQGFGVYAPLSGEELGVVIRSKEN